MTETYVETQTGHRWRDPRPVWRALALFYGVEILVYLLFTLYGALVLSQAQYWLPPDLAVVADSASLALNRIAVPIFIICAGLTMALTYILIANAHALEPSTKLTKPAMAIASYFIPLICLFMPPAVMGQLWRATFGASGRQPHGIIALWWSAFLIAAFIGTWAAFAESSADASKLVRGQTLGFVSRIIAASTLLYIFSSIVSQQLLSQRSRPEAT